MILCSELSAAFGIDQGGRAVGKLPSGWFRRRLPVVGDLNHVAGPQVEEGAGELAGAAGEVGKVRYLWRRTYEFIADGYRLWQSRPADLTRFVRRRSGFAHAPCPVIASK